MTSFPTDNTPAPSNQEDSRTAVIALKDAWLRLSGRSGTTDILKGINLTIPGGQHVAVVGPSGAGKTSLLMVMSGLEALSSGQAVLTGQDTTDMNEDSLAGLRRDNVGIVFQAFRLIPSMTAWQNVAVPLELSGQADAKEAAREALAALGLGHRLNHLPDQLSGGEQQRVAIARAIAPRPKILLADEPTGNLDSATGQQVITQLFAAARSVDAALVLITHDEGLAGQCERRLRMADGQIMEDSLSGQRQKSA
ncbi:MAG: ATP-binding cassette domain-containing protein [Pseudomonadota bacterium]|nr:ATP-binding cassette domain-containing protein [Pseudomonadota bacterium]